MFLNKGSCVERESKRHHLLWAILALTFLAAGMFSTSECAGQEDNSPELLAFSHLSYFSNRGFMKGMFPDSMQTVYGRDYADVPDEIHDYLKQRQTNLLTSQRNIEWLTAVPDNQRNLSATLGRLSHFGMIELFHHQNSRLLDKPLETRKELMDQLDAIARQIAVAHAGLISNKNLDEETLIVMFGHMRRLSVDFDLAVLNALSDDERGRIAQLVSVAMPASIEMIRQTNNDLGPFGFGKSK